MAEHWCKEHQTVWFKKGKMKGYAHPIKDAEGEDTDKWCNEPKEEAEEKPAPKRDSSTNASIEAQVAVKAVVELIVASKIDAQSPEVQATRNWIMSKLGNWSSMGSPPETEYESASKGFLGDKKESQEPMSTKEQRAKILSTYKERGYTDSLALSVMIRHYTVSESKKLTKKQASEFIKTLESGKHLEELSEPADIPF